jgi:GTP cyclohydrolase II
MTDKNREGMQDATPAKVVEQVASSVLPTRHGTFHMYVYRSLDEAVEQVALVMGDIRGQESLLVRVHSECLTGDVFGSQRCDCGEQLDKAMAKIVAEGRGAIIYLRGHEGRGIGLGNKIMAYALQDQGRDTVEANLDLGLPVDTRDYEAAARMLDDLGVRSVRLITNNPEKLSKLKQHGLNIVDRVPVRTKHTSHNIGYLRTKQQKLGHMLDFE